MRIRNFLIFAFAYLLIANVNSFDVPGDYPDFMEAIANY